MAERKSRMIAAVSATNLLFLIFHPGSLSGWLTNAELLRTQAKQALPQKSLNLAPSLHSPMNEEIRVRKFGSEPSSPSKLTLDCVRVGATPETNSCPDLPPSAAASYFDPAFPQHATIQVPSIAPGATFTHKLSFWSEMNWPKGKYKFTAAVRMSDSPQEHIAKDKVAVSILTVP
jgi:hypothetical protein